MNFINDSIYWHGTGIISDSLNRLVHEVLDCADLSDHDFALRSVFCKKINYLSDILLEYIRHFLCFVDRASWYDPCK